MDTPSKDSGQALSGLPVDIPRRVPVRRLALSLDGGRDVEMEGNPIFAFLSGSEMPTII